MRIYLPLSVLSDNPYQPTRRNYGDLLAYGRENIAPHIAARPLTYGIQTPPQIRILLDGELLPDPIATLTSRELLLSAPPTTAALEDHFARHFAAEAPSGRLTAQLLFGHRRTRALRALHEAGEAGFTGWAAVDIMQVDDNQMLRDVYAENAGRNNPSAVEDLQILQHSVDMGGTLREAAERAGMDYSRARSIWQLRNLPEHLMEANANGQLAQAHLEELLPALRVEPYLDGIRLRDKYEGDNWGAAPTPTAFINYALTTPPSKAQIRAYVKDIQRMGNEIPTYLEKTDVFAEGVIQHSCKQCPARLTTHCLNKSCYTTKLKELAVLYWEQHLQQYAWSDKEADLMRFATRWQAEKDFQAHIAAHPHDPNIVIGFVVGSAAARPTETEGYNSTHRGWGSNHAPQDFLAYGYTAKKLPAPAVSASGQPAEIDHERARRDRFVEYRKGGRDVAQRYRALCLANLTTALKTNVANMERMTTIVGAMLGTPTDTAMHQLANWILPEATDSEAVPLLDAIVEIHDRMTAAGIRTPELGDRDALLILLGSWREQGWSRVSFAARITGALKNPPFNHIKTAYLAYTFGQDLEYIKTFTD